MMPDRKEGSLVRKAFESVPTDLPTLMRGLGLVYGEDILRGPSAIVVPRNGEGAPRIEVNATDPAMTKRASVAYEIARWALGRERLLSQSEGRKTPGNLSKPVRHDTENTQERGSADPSTGISIARIHHVMSEILVPKDALCRVFAETGGDVNATASRFGVPSEYILMRALKHKLI